MVQFVRLGEPAAKRRWQAAFQILEPLRQNATVAGWGTNGASLGLALTKALAEANRADVTIKTAANTGTLIEIAFPADRAAAR